ncbi:Hypothetical protein NGAL_HAMBI2427_57490 [Neorhizobium galegae bv. orientalis]|uniref:Transmembrane protein n=1 Tax=Neorhizobium galegae bv. orientalis str. HAMBI 540 TaxID=1028800 RepID=A0A068T0D8_NEOGA|nr:Hypothetical protein RG540_PA09030 [Neorhizobium galegae bv. orientalis str. HAMBI 540]CDZ54668.1 Hypothetical protein NGAL_HAMBI2427_57490 [Neorhizobium galegae bv. orientalis]
MSDGLRKWAAVTIMAAAFALVGVGVVGHLLIAVGIIGG